MTVSARGARVLPMLLASFTVVALALSGCATTSNSSVPQPSTTSTSATPDSAGTSGKGNLQGAYTYWYWRNWTDYPVTLKWVLTNEEKDVNFASCTYNGIGTTPEGKYSNVEKLLKTLQPRTRSIDDRSDKKQWSFIENRANMFSSCVGNAYSGGKWFVVVFQSSNPAWGGKFVAAKVCSGGGCAMNHCPDDMTECDPTPLNEPLYLSDVAKQINKAIPGSNWQAKDFIEARSEPGTKLSASYQDYESQVLGGYRYSISLYNSQKVKPSRAETND